jgi:hypothetical protein
MGEDSTVHWSNLPAPVNPGESVLLEIAWEAQFPEIRFGSGWTGHCLVASMWYPKIGVYTDGGWICEPFSGNAAFTGNFGVFDVELSLPNRLVLANTGTIVTPLDESGAPLTDAFGRAVEAKHDPDRRLNFIYRAHAEDVQDFTWMAAPRGTWGIEWVDYRGTQVFLYCIGKNYSQIGRIKDAVRFALRSSEERLCPYPYPILSLVDLPRQARSAMDSPTIAAIHNVAFDPLRQRVMPEQTVFHKVGNQVFRGVAASGRADRLDTNAQLSAWFVGRAMDDAYSGLFKGKRFFMDADFAGWLANRPFSSRDRLGGNYMLHGLFEDGDNRVPTDGVSQLEAALGRQTLEAAIRAYLEEKCFKHPSGDDFRLIAERESGQSLGKLWEGHFETRGSLDYRIADVSQSSIRLERLGSLTAPITLWVRLEDGREISQVWDGEDEQATFSFEAPISAAALDPEQKCPALKSRLHATYTASPKKRGLQYWAQMAIGALGGFLQGMGLG